LILSWQFSSHVVRVVRAGVMETLETDYVATARSKGLPESVIVWKYALRSALVPALTMSSLQFGTLLGGALVLETLFGLPGIGRGLVQAALARDYPVIQSYAVLLVLLYMVVNLIVDMICRTIDPRITRSIEGESV
jgi:ABC-type dipeptide/oligopeptide/nickel transport system permease component